MREARTIGPCVCAQLRQTSRRVSVLYDKALAVTGITITQHGLLANIKRLDQVSVSALAAHLGMDRTTLTRNLKPLERAGLIVEAASSDRRTRLLRLSPAGNRTLTRSRKCWQNVQEDFAAKLGPAALKRLRDALRLAEIVADGVMAGLSTLS